MKNRNLFYLSMLAFSLMLTSCASYEVTSSSNKKNTSSNRYSYNTKPKTNKPATPAKSINSRSKSIALKSTHTGSSKSTEVKKVLTEADRYKGTPYKYGGNTSSGIDCSGLVSIAFQKIDMKLPRRSIDMSNTGSSISVSNVKEGDLIFFATGGGSINHVGIVHDLSSSGEIYFIHASTSKGVIISSLEETYWKGKFVKAQRVL